MTTNPNGYRTFPAYNAGYGYAPMATAPSSQKPAYPYPQASTSGLPYRTPVVAPNPFGNPYAAQTLQSLTNRSFMDRFLPLQPTTRYPPMVNAAPQQPMVISLTAPKMTKDEMHKKFWLMVAGGTVSIVSGLLLVSFFGLKLMPDRIASALTTQLHRSALNQLDKKAINNILDKIKHHELAEDHDTSIKLANKWGQKDVEAIFRTKKERTEFLRDISPHVPFIDLSSKFFKQLVKKTATPDLFQEQTDNLLSAINNSLITEKNVDAAINFIPSLIDKATELKAMKPAERLQQVRKHITLQESIALLARQSIDSAVTPELMDKKTAALLDSVKNSLITEQNLNEAIDTIPCLKAQKAHLETMGNTEKLAAARQLVTLQDTLAHLTKQSIDSAVTPELMDKKTAALLDSVKNSLITEQNLEEAINSIPSLKNNADEINAKPTVEEKLKHARSLVTLQDTTAFLAQHSIGSALNTEFQNAKSALWNRVPSIGWPFRGSQPQPSSSIS